MDTQARPLYFSPRRVEERTYKAFLPARQGRARVCPCFVIKKFRN